MRHLLDFSKWFQVQFSQKMQSHAVWNTVPARSTAQPLHVKWERLAAGAGCWAVEGHRDSAWLVCGRCD